MKVLTSEQLEKKKARRMKRYSEHPEKYLEYAKKYKNEHRDEHNTCVVLECLGPLMLIIVVSLRAVSV